MGTRFLLSLAILGFSCPRMFGTELDCPHKVILDSLCTQLQSKQDTDFVPVLIVLKIPDSLRDTSISKDPKLSPPAGGDTSRDSSVREFLKAHTELIFTQFDLRSVEEPGTRLGVPTVIHNFYGPLLASKQSLLALSSKPYILELYPGNPKNVGIWIRPKPAPSHKARERVNILGRVMPSIRLGVPGLIYGW